MTYQGNVAYQLDEWQAAPPQRPLRVHEGGRRAERPQGGRAPIALIKLAVAFGLAFAVFGFGRIALTVATVDTLKLLNVAESTVESARQTRTQLQVERSSLSSADRISGIATENYGMVLASEVDTITIPESDLQEGAQEEAPVEEGFAPLDVLRNIFS